MMKENQNSAVCPGCGQTVELYAPFALSGFQPYAVLKVHGPVFRMGDGYIRSVCPAAHKRPSDPMAWISCQKVISEEAQKLFDFQRRGIANTWAFQRMPGWLYDLNEAAKDLHSRAKLVVMDGDPSIQALEALMARLAREMVKAADEVNAAKEVKVKRK